MSDFAKKRKEAALGYVPFLAAEWMRRRKYSPLTAEVGRALDAMAQAQCDLDKAYDALEEAGRALKIKVEKITQEVEKDSGGASGL